jgi:MYXO-CTERM domain-containing protein
VSTSNEVQAEGPAPSMVPSGAYNKTADEEAVQDHPKGCGCVAAGLDAKGTLGMSALLSAGLGLAVARRRRKA